MTANLTGAIFPCSFAFTGPPVVGIAGNQIGISSPVTLLGCPPIPGSVPAPYSLSAAIGPLPDGAYVLTWGTQVPSVFSVQVLFSIMAGAVVASQPTAIPTLSQWTAVILTLLLGISGPWCMRRNARASQRE